MSKMTGKNGYKSILVCRCAERGLLTGIDDAVDACDEGRSAVVPDLCRAAAGKAEVLKEIASSSSPVIYACHPRAVRALFAFAGYPLPPTTEFVNLRTPEHRPAQTPTGEASPAWYPVIDSERCTQCGQCFDFCLFGVYEKDDAGRVVVANPEACKNNCPACARICPATAIIFPKVGEAPINGAKVSDEELRKANVKINVDEILGDDVYAALRARKEKRRSLLNKKKIAKALAERAQCSEKKA